MRFLTIPREEELISVPMVDIRVNADGLKAPDAVELVTKPLEEIIKDIDGSNTSTARRSAIARW